MLNSLIIYTFSNVTFLIILIYIHELGHYVMGRYIGIPKKFITIRMLKFPQHVALISNDQIIPPTKVKEFEEVYSQYDNSGKYSYSFLNSGSVAENIAIVLLTIFFVIVIEIPIFAASLLLVAILLELTYSLMCLYYSLKNNYPWGDLGGMWVISKEWTIVNIIINFAIRLTLFIYIIAIL